MVIVSESVMNRIHALLPFKCCEVNDERNDGCEELLCIVRLAASSTVRLTSKKKGLLYSIAGVIMFHSIYSTILVTLENQYIHLIMHFVRYKITTMGLSYEAHIIS